MQTSCVCACKRNIYEITETLLTELYANYTVVPSDGLVSVIYTRDVRYRRFFPENRNVYKRESANPLIRLYQQELQVLKRTRHTDKFGRRQTGRVALPKKD